MSELRWTLLILGVAFIAALSWWERRRPRQAFAPRLRESTTAHFVEPWIGDTEPSDAVPSEAGLTGAAVLEELPMLVIPDEDERVALQAAWDATLPEPTLIDPEASVTTDAPAPPPQPVAAGGPQSEIPGAEGVGAVRIVQPPVPGGDGAALVEPLVEWPLEQSCRIIALRLVAPVPERFPGRTLRLALAAEGFLLGKFSIFHKPDEANRAVLSAASLTRPGAFDLESMDSQRCAGLSLFAVLPGPKAPAQAFEDLLATARNLNERLQGALQDERGGPLTALRVASIRESLRAEAADPPAAAAHGE